MINTYKPSGKISPALFPMFIITVFLIVPAFSFLSVILIWFLPSTLVDIIVYTVSFAFLATFTSKLCITYGKVRNKKWAGFTAFIVLIWFCYLSLTVFYCMYTDQKDLNDIIPALTNPIGILDAVKQLFKEGYSVETYKFGSLFVIKGPILAILWSIKFLISMAYILFFLIDESAYPFCEATKKWARKHKLLFAETNDMTEFKKQLLFGNITVLRNLELLKETNANHIEAELYTSRGESSFYITLKEKIRKENPDKDGNVNFDEEDIAEYAAIDSETCSILINQWKNQDTPAAAKIINSKIKKENKKDFIKTISGSIGQNLIFILFIFYKDKITTNFTDIIIVSYLCLNLFIWIVEIYLAFKKEAVIHDEWDEFSSTGVSSWQIEKISKPIYYKIFYILMLVITLILLFYCLKEIFI